MRKSILVLAGLLGLLAPGSAKALTVDVNGNLSEWGVSLGNNNTSNYANVAGITRMVEDSDDNAGLSGFVGPNSGGQKYDAEYLGATIQGANLYIGIVTGQRPDNGSQYFEPGDIRIVTTYGASYGIEVGGGTGSTSRTSGQITEGGAGSFYSLNSSGYVSGVSSSHVVGGLYATTNSNWYTENVGGAPYTMSQLQMTGGTYLGLADYVYDWNLYSDHATIELSINLAAFNLAAGDSIASIAWQPACGNDLLNINMPSPPPPTAVPEPGSLALLALGASSVVVGRRARRRA